MLLNTIQEHIEKIRVCLIKDMEAYESAIKQDEQPAEVMKFYQIAKATLQEFKHKLKHYDRLLTEDMERYLSHKR